MATGGLLRQDQQTEVSLQRRMPVDNVGSDALQTITAEAVAFSFYSSGVLTADAGEAAGTVVVAKLAQRNIKSALGDVTGSYGDTSFSWGAGTILTRLRQFDQIAAEQAERNAENVLLQGAAKAVAVTTGFKNGDYCIDHRTGVTYGVKATTGTSDTATYKIETAVSGGGGGVASDVNINQVGGVTTAAGTGIDTAGALRVSLATDIPLPAGTNAIGKLSANTGVDIGDVDVTSSSIDQSINGPAVATAIDSYQSVAINVAAGATDSVLVAAPGADKQIWVYGIEVVSDVAGSISIQDSADLAITGVVLVGANGGYAHSPSGNFEMPLWKCATNVALEMDTVTCTVDGSLSYAVIDVS